MTDFRALCAELADRMQHTITWGDIPEDVFDLMQRARIAVAQAEPEFTPEEVEMIQAPCTLPTFDCHPIVSYLTPPPPEPQGPTLDDIVELCAEHEFILGIDGANEEESAKGLLEIARAALARWGRSTIIKPVPVSERLPGPGDCTTNPRTGQGQWCWGWVQHDDPPYSGRWRMMRKEWLAGEAVAWLPYYALPVPQQEVDRG
jgi:hypothetical protein